MAILVIITFVIREGVTTFPYLLNNLPQHGDPHFAELRRGGRNRIGRREKWPKKSWEEGEIGGKSREEGEKVR